MWVVFGWMYVFMYVSVGGWCLDGCMGGYVVRCVAGPMDLSLCGCCLCGYMDGFVVRLVVEVWMYGLLCW